MQENKNESIQILDMNQEEGKETEVLPNAALRFKHFLLNYAAGS